MFGGKTGLCYRHLGSEASLTFLSQTINQELFQSFCPILSQAHGDLNLTCLRLVVMSSPF